MKKLQMQTKVLIAVFMVCLTAVNKPLFALWNPNDATSTVAVLSLATSADGTKLLAGSHGAGCYVSLDNGTNWTQANTALGGSSVRTLLVSGANIYAGTENGIYLTQSTNLGTGAWGGWTAKNSGLGDMNVLSMAISLDATKLFAGTSSGVYYSSNNGSSWSAVNSGLTSSYVTALAVSGGNIFAATLGGVFLSSNNGASWTAVNTGLTNLNVYTIAVLGTKIFVGTDDGIFVSSNNGTTWNSANAGMTSLDVNCIIVNGSNLIVGTFSGGVFSSSDNAVSWNAVSTNLASTYVNSLAVSGLNLYIGTSNVSVVSGVINGGGEGAPMPVELTSLTASTNGSAVTLGWNTATEVNTYGFEIQRSSSNNAALKGAGATQLDTNKTWEKIGFVEGHGTTNKSQTYRFTDNSASGKVSYRLKQIDADGKYTYSHTVETAVTVPLVYTLSQNYPNPFNPTTTMIFTVPRDGRAVVKVFNILGQEVAMLFDGIAEAGKYHQVRFDAAGLASGTYFSRLEYDGKVQIKKMQLVR